MRTYRGWKIAKFEGVQVGYKKDPLGRERDARRIKGYLFTDPNGYDRHADTLTEAKERIDFHIDQLGDFGQ